MNDQSEKLRALHITNWYPNKWKALETQFIRELYSALPEYVRCELWHVQVRHEGSMFRLCQGSYSNNEHYLVLDTKIRQWRLVELLSLGLLVLLRIKLGLKKWDLVNIHIAYPLLRFPRLFSFLFGKKCIISEHWSAYHHGFHLPDNSRAQRRIQNIFRQTFPVISVSSALSQDIADFSGQAEYRRYVVPNVVDPTLFYPPEARDRSASPMFLMASSWAPIKQPLLVFEAFKAVLSETRPMTLKVIGYGEQWESMEAFVERNALADNIIMLGARPKAEIAGEMRQCTAFLHASEYETFSVVCAEALCSGLPVIASNVGGIVEFVNESNGVLVENTLEDWIKALAAFSDSEEAWDQENISREATRRFNPDTVGQRLADIYKEIVSTGGNP